MTRSNATGATLTAWQKGSGSRFGRWLFARRMARWAPYVGTIHARVVELRPALCRVAMPMRAQVQGRRGALHEVAIGNLCQLAADLVTAASLPPTLEWATRGMTIEYLRASDSGAVATARLDKKDWTDSQTFAVPVSVVDGNGTEVVRAVITIHASVRRA